MIELDKELHCNGQVIASHILIPETSKEKEMGMRGRTIELDTAMLFVFRKKELLLFNMWGVKERLGVIVLDGNKTVTHVGTMKPWMGGFFGWGKYLIEVHHNKVNGIKKGDTITGLE